MKTTQTNTLVTMAYEDLQKLINDEYAELKIQAFLKRYENILVGVKDVAHFHNVSTHTVTNYIKDGLIEPEVKVNENEHPKFRMSYALALDFKELQKKLRAKNRGW
jgi:hypothetical protein